MEGFPDPAAAAPAPQSNSLRLVPPTFGGVFNFRDLAEAQGPETLLRSGLIYRADGLNRCTIEESNAVAHLGVRRVLDLRTDTECATDGVFSHPNVVTVHIPMVQPSGDSISHLHAAQGSNNNDLMAEFYFNIAALNSGAIALCIAEIIASAADNEPLVVHCTTGKDRTGIVAALALSLAGVDDHLIAADYERSASAIASIDQWFLESDDSTRNDRLAGLGVTSTQRRLLNSAAPETMLVFLAGLRERYGSIVDYLSWGGTDRAELDRCHAVFKSPNSATSNSASSNSASSNSASSVERRSS